ncbi:hypothetical protein AB0N05_37775 [Nocardia sp. NPDC051030]|uniref:hypothetical protein n=1 Tax=Nocardia sp. NPDC051030 TaxID=3155162 RepID=UPI003442BC50
MTGQLTAHTGTPDVLCDIEFVMEVDYAGDEQWLVHLVARAATTDSAPLRERP